MKTKFNKSKKNNKKVDEYVKMIMNFRNETLILQYKHSIRESNKKHKLLSNSTKTRSKLAMISQKRLREREFERD